MKNKNNETKSTNPDLDPSLQHSTTKTVSKSTNTDLDPSLQHSTTTIRSEEFDMDAEFRDIDLLDLVRVDFKDFITAMTKNVLC